MGFAFSGLCSLFGFWLRFWGGLHEVSAFIRPLFFITVGQRAFTCMLGQVHTRVYLTYVCGCVHICHLVYLHENHDLGSFFHTSQRMKWK